MNTERWMTEMDGIKDRPLKDIVIPGSHDAGTWDLQLKINNISTQTQDVDILAQLKAGSRYLDLRAWRWDQDNKFYMFHGPMWANTALDDVVSQIKEFLKDHPGEILIATLLLENAPGDTEWRKVCESLKDYLVTPDLLSGKSVALATPNELRSQHKNLVLLPWGAPSIDRDGVYVATQHPELILQGLDRYYPPQDKLWIFHLGMPYGIPLLESLRDKANRCADFFLPRFRENFFRTRRLNILNVDFVNHLSWVNAIVDLNNDYPKTWPPAVSKRIVALNDTLYLRHMSGEYIAAAERGRYDWPKLAMTGRVKLQILGGAGDLTNGATVKVKSTEGDLNEYNILGAFGDSHNCYYYKDNYDRDKQGWQISAVAGGADGRIHYGDRVYISNRSYAGQKLTRDTTYAGYVSTSASADDWWILEQPT